MTLQCPHFGHSERPTMPATYDQFLYECTSCHELLNAKEGECCFSVPVVMCLVHQRRCFAGAAPYFTMVKFRQFLSEHCKT